MRPQHSAAFALVGFACLTLVTSACSLGLQKASERFNFVVGANATSSFGRIHGFLADDH